MKIKLRDLLQHKQTSRDYACIVCGQRATKTAALPATLPAFYEEYCKTCKVDRKFIKVETN